jgi:hypothetical protein
MCCLHEWMDIVVDSAQGYLVWAAVASLPDLGLVDLDLAGAAVETTRRGLATECRDVIKDQ